MIICTPTETTTQLIKIDPTGLASFNFGGVAIKVLQGSGEGKWLRVAWDVGDSSYHIALSGEYGAHFASQTAEEYWHYYWSYSFDSVSQTYGPGLVEWGAPAGGFLFAGGIFFVDYEIYSYPAEVESFLLNHSPDWLLDWTYRLFGPSPPGGAAGGKGDSRSATSTDPNSMLGPAGYGPSSFVANSATLPYQIDFENDPTATAPAQAVTITDQLDSNLDWSTFKLSGIGWGDTNPDDPRRQPALRDDRLDDVQRPDV